MSSSNLKAICFLMIQQKQILWENKNTYICARSQVLWLSLPHPPNGMLSQVSGSVPPFSYTPNGMLVMAMALDARSRCCSVSEAWTRPGLTNWLRSAGSLVLFCWIYKTDQRWRKIPNMSKPKLDQLIALSRLACVILLDLQDRSNGAKFQTWANPSLINWLCSTGSLMLFFLGFTK